MTLREGQIAAHDLGVFGDWDVVDRNAVGAVTFERSGRATGFAVLTGAALLLAAVGAALFARRDVLR